MGGKQTCVLRVCFQLCCVATPPCLLSWNCSSGELILSVILQSATHHHHRHPIMTPSPLLHAPRPRQRRAVQVEKSPDGGRLLIYYPSLCCQVTLFDSSFTTLPSSPPLLCPHTLICLIRESDPCRLPSPNPEGRSGLGLVIMRGQ